MVDAATFSSEIYYLETITPRQYSRPADKFTENEMSAFVFGQTELSF